MKLITAIIQPDMLDDVRESLVKKGITRITVARCTGKGRVEEVDIHRGAEFAPDLAPKIRIDIACNKEFVELTIDTILEAARHDGGAVGDGKIFITELEDCIRIRTGERGVNAV